MRIKIGIPATLFYYSHFPFWKRFFEELNMEVISSPVTTKEIVDLGVKEAVNDACVPIKIFHGHVVALKKKADYLFIPRFVSISDKATFCPKFLGLPDMIRFSIPDLPPLIEPRIDLKSSKIRLWKICNTIAAKFSFSKIKVIKAYLHAQKSQIFFERKLIERIKPLEFLKYNRLISFDETKERKNSSVKIAVLGYPYEVYDPFISVNILKKLEHMGVIVVTLEMIPGKILAKAAAQLPKNLFWYYSNQVIKGAFHYLSNGVDGLIHISAFGCGPDAMVNKLIELEAKQRNRTPFMTLTIDEHSGEAGIQTRLEAFVDMIKLRKGQVA